MNIAPPPESFVQAALCENENCRRSFVPRKGNGGGVQRFCSAKCRKSSQRPPDAGPTLEQPKPAPSPKDVHDFDWNKDSDSIVLHHQPSVAIYWNGSGGLTIRQERAWDQEEDTITVVSVDNVMTFIDKLTDIVGIPSLP